MENSKQAIKYIIEKKWSWVDCKLVIRRTNLFNYNYKIYDILFFYNYMIIQLSFFFDAFSRLFVAFSTRSANGSIYFSSMCSPFSTYLFRLCFMLYSLFSLTTSFHPCNWVKLLSFSMILSSFLSPSSLDTRKE